jgi:hypothetical protein
MFPPWLLPSLNWAILAKSLNDIATVCPSTPQLIFSASNTLVLNTAYKSSSVWPAGRLLSIASIQSNRNWAAHSFLAVLPLNWTVVNCEGIPALVNVAIFGTNTGRLSSSSTI